MAGIYRPNPFAAAEIEHGPLMRIALHEIGAAAVSRAQSVAPVLTGAYRASIHEEDSSFDGKPSANVVASVPYAPYVEFGTSDTPEFAPLRRGIKGF